MSQTFEEKLNILLFEAVESAASYSHKVSAEEADYIQDSLKQDIIKLIDEHYVPKDESYAYQLVVAEFEALLNRYKDWDYAQERLYEYKKAIESQTSKERNNE